MTGSDHSGSGPERKSAEEELRRTGELLRAVADETPDAIFVKDRSGRYLLFNAAAGRLTGKEPAEVLGRDDMALFDAKSAREVMDRDREVMATGVPEMHEEALTIAGTTRTYLVTKAPYRDAHGDIVGVIGISRDITDRRAAEEALRERDALYRPLMENANDFIRLHDVDGRSVYGSPSVDRLYGLAPTTLFEFAHPEDLQSCREWWARVLAGIGERFEWRVRDREGHWRWLETQGSLVPYQGRPHVMTICRDVTERKAAEAAQRESERTLVHAQRIAHLGYWENDLDADRITWSEETRRILGLGPERSVVTSAEFRELIKPEDRVLQANATAEALRGDGSYDATYRIVRPDGGIRFIHSIGEVIRDESGRPRHAFGVVQDITGQKLLEDQLRQAQKMEAIGHLAGGVAHDFNNLLTIISGNSELLLPRLAPDDPNREFISEIWDAGERAAALTRQLLAFSRRTVLDPRILDLNDVVRENERMLRRLIGEDVHLVTQFDPELKHVKVDPAQIGQVIMNLAVNARDAMPTGGKLVIETGNVQADETFAAAHPDTKPGPYVLLTVTDTGSGMTEEVRAHLFEPFFTTKGPGKGTGLGLPTVYGIVRQSGGVVAVDTEPGRGTSFKLYFPTADAGPAGIKSQQEAPAALGHETILLVEDEDAVRSIVLRVLQHSGYTVLATNRGAEAIRLAERHPDRIHLLVTDVVMPEMGGRQLVEHLTGLRPDLKVLYLSGYTEEAVIRHGVLHAEVAFLQKPFTISALTTTVRRVLDADVPSPGR